MSQRCRRWVPDNWETSFPICDQIRRQGAEEQRQPRSLIHDIGFPDAG